MIVLVADDLDINRKLLRSLLAADGYEVIEAANGVDAFNILKNATGPVVGLIDWEMPQMEGIEVCQQARKLQFSPPIYLILLTVRTTVAYLTGSAMVYFLQPMAWSVIVAVVLVGSAVARRPFTQRFAQDFCAFDPGASRARRFRERLRLRGCSCSC